MILELAVLLTLLSPSAPEPCTSGVPGEAFIILVGRNQPPASTNLPDLSYAESDALGMKRAAVERMCFPPDARHTIVLTGAAATPERLKAELWRITRNKSRTIGRLFVYVSAHGSEESQILLKTPMPIETLKTLVRDSGATQRMLFLDTCNSASDAKRSTRKGDGVELTMAAEPGFFWFAAAKHTAFERTELRSGEVTSLFLKWVNQAKSLDSRGLCERMKAGHHWDGACETTSSSAGIVIVPKDRPLGRLRVLDGQRWTHVIFPVGAGKGGGFHMTAVRMTASANATPRNTFAPGRYYLQRYKVGFIDCQRSAPFEVYPNKLHEVRSEDWSPDPANCDYMKYGREIPARPKVALWIGVGLDNGWVPGISTAGHLQLGFNYTPHSEGTRYGAQAQLTYARPDGRSPRPMSMMDGVLALAVDPVYGSVDTMGFSAGLEAGGGYTWVERSGLTGLVALRGGAVLRYFSILQPELMGRVGVRVYAATRRDEREIAPWFGVTLGTSYSLEAGTP